MNLRVHSLMETSRVNGPGRRAVVWLQGCSLRCPGCWNPETHGRAGGVEMNVIALVEWVRSLLANEVVTGVTISGGEPLEQPEGLAVFAEGVRELCPHISLGLFSGYTERELAAGRFKSSVGMCAGAKKRFWRRIESCLDFAVLGRFNRSLPAYEPLVASRNQSLRLLSSRHCPGEFSTQEFEISIGEDGLTQITGFPVVRTRQQILFSFDTEAN
jgi:anaerobic ribonucleoside-triphosphate reductase activating protein